MRITALRLLPAIWLALGAFGSSRSAYACPTGATCCTGGSPCIYGDNTNSGPGVEGDGVDVYGVYGHDSGNGDGVHGIAAGASGTGAYGSGGANGVYGLGVGSGTTYGVNGKAQGSNTASAGVYGTGYTGGAFHGTATGVYGDCTGTGCNALYISGAATITGALTVGSCSGCTSDVRLKKNVKPLAKALDQLLQLKGVTFEWIDPTQHENDGATQRGFIAQDVEKVFPNWVREAGYTAPDGQKYKTLELRQIEALEVESIRELRSENERLEARLKSLEEARRPVVSTSLNGLGLGVGGLALAGALVFNRRKREDGPVE